MAEEETPKEGEEKKEEEITPSEEEEFEPPVREKTELPPEPPPSGETPEGKRFWYELRKINERLDRIESGYLGETELGEEKKRTFEPELSEVDEKFSAILGEIDKRERRAEIREFLRDNPDFKKYGPKLEKFAFHPAYSNVPIDFVAKALAFEEAEKIGAKKGKEADLEAEKTKIGGSPFKPSEKEFPDYEGMSKEEFEKEVAKAKKPKE